MLSRTRSSQAFSEELVKDVAAIALEGNAFPTSVSTRFSCQLYCSGRGHSKLGRVKANVESSTHRRNPADDRNTRSNTSCSVAISGSSKESAGRTGCCRWPQPAPKLWRPRFTGLHQCPNERVIPLVHSDSTGHFSSDPRG